MQTLEKACENKVYMWNFLQTVTLAQHQIQYTGYVK